MVRNFDENIMDYMITKEYSYPLNNSIFETKNFYKDDEIVLCLNYDGIYGINNLNNFFQEENPNKKIN
jgi:hypothetical protein